MIKRCLGPRVARQYSAELSSPFSDYHGLSSISLIFSIRCNKRTLDQLSQGPKFHRSDSKSKRRSSKAVVFLVVCTEADENVITLQQGAQILKLLASRCLSFGACRHHIASTLRAKEMERNDYFLSLQRVQQADFKHLDV